MSYAEGDWIQYRRHSGTYTTTGKVLESRPDGKLVVGSHDRDPEPDVIEEESVVGELDG